MSKYIKLDTAIEHTNQLYHGYEVEAWLNSLPTIEVSEDCINRQQAIEILCRRRCGKDVKGCPAHFCPISKEYDNLPSVAPSVVPSRAEGEWEITEAYPHNVYCSECHKKFAQTHWAVWEDGSLPRNYCPNCGAKMKGADDEINSPD